MTIPHLIILALVIILAIVTGLLIYLYVNFRRLKGRISAPRLKETLQEKYYFEQLLQNIPDRIYIKDLDSRFIIANKYVSNIMGTNNPEDLVGKTDFDFYDRDSAQPYFDDEQRIMKEGKPMIAKEEKGLDEKGNEISVSTTKIPLRDKNNKVIGILGIGRDVSVQKQAEEKLRIQSEYLKETNVLLEERQEEIQQMAEELNVQSENLREINVQLERLSLVASRTENVVIIMDGKADFVWVNQGFEDKYGTTMKAYVNEHGVNLADNSSNQKIAEILDQIYLEKKPFTYTSKSINSEGEEVWNQTNITPIVNQDEEITYLILIDSDITELKRAENQIQQQKDVIEARTVELQSLNTTKDRLFSIIAHDLKNPFHSIMGFTDILQKRYKDIDRDKLNEFLEMINLSTRSAYQLLENLLEWARSQTEKMKINPDKVVIKQIVNEIMELQNLHASNKQISLIDEVPLEIVAFADRNMLNTVIRNITSNAIKYTNPGGTITFRSTTQDEETVIEITDTGIGIPEDKLQDLFQLDKVSSTAGTGGETGTGLGLIVCFDFMRKNNGRIETFSKAGKGTTFKLTLPKSEAK